MGNKVLNRTFTQVCGGNKNTHAAAAASSEDAISC
jgi:hypothetical protein